MIDIEHMISQFIDNELNETDQQEMFSILKNDSVARKILRDFIRIDREAFTLYQSSYLPPLREKQQNQILHEFKLNQKEVSGKFEKKIFSSVLERKQSFSQRWTTKPTPVYVNYVLGIVIIVITLFSFLQLRSLRNDLNSFQVKYSNSIQKVSEQTEIVKILLKSLTPIKVTPYDAGNIIRTNL